MKKESALEKEAVKYFKRYGVITYKLEGSNDAGKPDRIVLFFGGIVEFIEFKKEDEPAKEHQKFMHKLLRNQGYMVTVVDNLQQIRDMVKRNCQ